MSETERCRHPCGNCPWRKDAPREYWDPEHFREIWQNCQDDGLHMMLCHKASQVQAVEDKPICQGWVRVMGYDAIGVRIALLRDRVTWKEVEDNVGPALFASFEEMLAANNVTPPDRNRFIQNAVSELDRHLAGRDRTTYSPRDVDCVENGRDVRPQPGPKPNGDIHDRARLTAAALALPARRRGR